MHENACGADKMTIFIKWRMKQHDENEKKTIKLNI